MHTDKEGYKTVDYAKLSAVLLQGLKEQQSEIATLEERLEAQDHNIEVLTKLIQESFSTQSGDMHSTVSGTEVSAIR